VLGCCFAVSEDWGDISGGSSTAKGEHKGKILLGIG